jgi:hypothetical protein
MKNVFAELTYKASFVLYQSTQDDKYYLPGKVIEKKCW